MGKKIRSCGCVALAAVAALAAALWWGYTRLFLPTDAVHTDDPVSFEILQTDAADAVGYRLEDQGVIRSAKMFTWLIRLRGQDSALLPGTYSIAPGLNVNEVINVIVSGPEKLEVQVTLLEGWTNAEMAQAIAQVFAEEARARNADIVLGQGLSTQEEDLETLLLSAMDSVDVYRAEYAFLEDVPAGRTTEGFLFPDTYRFHIDDSAQVVVRRLLSTFDTKVASVIAPQDETWFELITLASVVEGESGRKVDNAGIAGVFRNRLAIGQKLESDATVNYATGNSNPRPTFAELATESLYNTYKYPGLPYGPVGNPGFDAIADTIEYEEHDYFFFIGDQRTGETIFGRNAAEHQRNIEQYLD